MAKRNEDPFGLGADKSSMPLFDLDALVGFESKQVLEDVRQNLEAFKAASGSEENSGSDSESDSDSDVNQPFWDIYTD